MKEPQSSSMNEKDGVVLKELFQKFGNWFQFLKSQWLKIGLVSLLGAIIGFLYAYLQPIKYSAKIMFVVEETKTGGGSLSNLASLAGQFGLDVGGGGGSGILSGDNILFYFKSPSLAREVLLSPYDSGSKKSLIDEYVAVYELKDDWKKIAGINEMYFQPAISGKPYTRIQDSLIQLVIDKILKKQFSVERTDKKASFIEVSANMENELLSKRYCERIVDVAVKRYVQVKTQRQKSTVDKLQYRVDSIMGLLSQKTIASANLQTSTATMDINPLYRTNTVIATETTTRDKTMLATIFASVTQNLEIAKFTLSQETPVIQVIDAPTIPLKQDKVSKLKMLVLFGFVFFFVYIVFAIAKREMQPHL